VQWIKYVLLVVLAATAQAWNGPMIAVPLLYGARDFPAYRLWKELPLVDLRLLGPFTALAWRFYLVQQKPLWITCIGRTPEENVRDKGHENSGHLLKPDAPVRAIDLRINPRDDYPGLTPEEQAWLIKHWKEDFRRGQYWSLYVHRGDHIHCQVPSLNAP
jgi:hypothetical protein